MPEKIIIFGFGYTASFLAKKLAKLGFYITGTSRNKDCIGFHHKETPYELIHFDTVDMVNQLESATHVLVSIPPTEIVGDPVLSAYKELLKKHADHIKWLGYLSSTGVYGDHQGRWVNEGSASISPGKQGALRLDAETAWNSFANEYHLPLHIFRLSGIYGPQNNALARIKHGKKQTIYKEGQFFSRIHVEDIAEIIATSLQYPNPNSVYNMSDDEPTPSHIIDEYAASLMNLPSLEQVPFAEAALSPMAKEFYTHNKRVSNSKIKKELSITLNYPTYREGLKKIYDDGDY